jgi:23S rRNA (adenine2503-C2)-methyltransferase
MRNLNPDEIYDQVVEIDKQSQLYYNRPLTNIVFMGMGEPLMNYKNTLTAIDKITSPDGLGMSPKRITVSTSGITKIIREISDLSPKFKLAVSLHSAIEETRNRLMPFTKAFPLDQLLVALKYWYENTKSKVTFEVVVWKDINDKQVDIDALVSYCKQVPSKVNLIEYNAIGDDQFVQARPEAISAYTTALENNRISVTVRRSRGKDIDAACGQLANKNNEFPHGQDV